MGESKRAYGTYCRLALALSAALCWQACDFGGADPPASRNARPESNPVDVVVVSPVRQDLTRSITLPASVAAYETTTLLSRVTGYLREITVDIGDAVRSGQLIARIDVPELEDELRETEAELTARQADLTTAEAELLSARAELDLRRITHERIEAVRDEEPDAMAQQTLDEARAELELAKASLSVNAGRIQQIESAIAQVRASAQQLRTRIGFAEIRAPFDGVVSQRHVDPGTLLQAETSSRTVQRIVTLASIDRLRLRVDVPEAEVPYVQVGDPVRVSLDSLPDRSFETSVARFAGVLDPSTRTMRTEADLPNHGRRLRPGMYGRATLSLDTKADAITIPAEALRIDGTKQFVYCVEQGRAKRRDVRASVGDGLVVEVIEGLAGRESVVVAARGPIADGAAVIAAQGGTERLQ
ncbi:MAG: efflux RND transporter periplasmic adaptor subunit [Bryobacterales bacterium]|nr:efflux RND transporter periplasmic adaptor subunit [Bryobacterales bacterium]